MKEPSPLYHAIRHAASCRILPRLFLKNTRPLQAASGRLLPGFPLEKNGPRLAAATNRIQARVLPARFLAPGKRQFGKTTHRRPKSRRIARGRVLGHRRHKGLRFGVFPDQFIERERKRILEKTGRRNRRALRMRKQENRCVRPLWISVLHAVHATGPRLRQFHHQERWRLQWKTCSPS